MDTTHVGTGLLRWKTGAAALTVAALSVALARPATAQTVSVSARQLSAIGNLAPGQEPARLYDSPVPSVSGWCVIGQNEPNWTEYAFNVPAAGVYSVKLNYATPLSGISVTLDVRPTGGALHYAVYGLATPSSGDWVAFKDATAVSMPLSEGPNVIRVENVGAFNKVPNSSGRTGSGVNVGGFTLTRTGDIPTGGAISGTVTSSDLGIPVGQAVVMAVDASKTVAEPGYHWYNGYWTLTDDVGAYSLPVPAGSYTVQAGRQDTYAAAGATVTGVAVTAAGSATANPALASRWAPATSSITVQAEDYAAKTPDVIGGPWTTGWGMQTGSGFNGGINIGWIEAGDYAVVNVDVAPSAAGWYRIDHLYQNGGATGAVTYRTDRGSSSTDTTPSTGGWTTNGSKTFASPIYLFAGRNEITVTCEAVNSNFDAFRLTKTTNAATKVRVELEKYANLGSGSGASPTGGSGGVNVIPGGASLGLDGLKVSGSSVGSFSTWSQQGAPEYLEFFVGAPADGLYAPVLRCGTPVATTALRLWNLTCGAVIDNTFSMPAGCDWGESQYGQSTGANLLPMLAGPNRLRVYIIDAGINADWVELTKAADLTGYGVVSGAVTAAVAPVSNAQVAVDVSAAGIPGAPVTGFRAVTDSRGRYSLVAPAGQLEVAAAALGHDDTTQPGASATVDFAEGAPKQQGFTLTPDGKYEAEWFSRAWQNAASLAKDHGLGFGDDVSNASQGQVIGAFDTAQGESEWVEFDVISAADGLYSLTLRYASDGQTTIRLSVAETGASFEQVLTPSGGFGTYADGPVTKPVALRAGSNRLRLTNTTATGVNLDYFTLANSGQQPGVVAGTVSNVSVTPSVPIAGVVVTVRDASANLVATTTTGADGKYSILLEPGAYTLEPALTGYSGSPGNATVTAGTTTVMDFAMTQGLIKGYVRNQLGQPVAGTRVIAYADEFGMQYDPNNPAYASYRLNQTTTDAGGYYEMAVRQGPAFVVAGAPMSVPASKLVSATPIANADLVVQKLKGGTVVPLSYNQDWFVETPNGTDFTVDGLFQLPGVRDYWTPAAAYDAAVAGNPISFLDVPFRLGSPLGSSMNVIDLVSPGNVIDVPDRRCAAIVVLGTSSNGNWPSDSAYLKQNNPFTAPLLPTQGAEISYSDGTSEFQLFHLPNWGYNQGAIGREFRENAWEVVQWACRSNRGTSWEFIRFNLVAVVLAANPAKTVTRVTLPNDLLLDPGTTDPFVFAVTMAEGEAAPLAQAKQALAIAAGLATASAADMTALNVVTTGASAGKIDVADASALAKLGL